MKFTLTTSVRPVAVFNRLDPVTVGTQKLAFSGLRDQDFPGSPHCTGAQVESFGFGVNMVEVQNSNICDVAPLSSASTTKHVDQSLFDGKQLRSVFLRSFRHYCVMFFWHRFPAIVEILCKLFSMIDCIFSTPRTAPTFTVSFSKLGPMFLAIPAVVAWVALTKFFSGHIMPEPIVACAIIGWNGKLPKGLLTQLLLKSERRGRDSTGLAFRAGGSTVSYRQAIPASEFVSDPDNNKFLGDARRALMGIAHTRRASPNMPIDNKNAHPFLYWKYFFAHNGKIQNWRELQAQLVVHFTEVVAKSEGETRKTAEWCINYCRNAQTDSKILGPYIHTEDFTPIVGCMALVWLKGDDVYTTRMAKEATATTVVWRYINPPKGEVIEDNMVTLVGSTHEIINDAFKSLARTIEYDCGEFFDFPEGVIYKVTPTGLVEHKKLSTFVAIEDQFTSAEVQPAATEAVREEVKNGESVTAPGEPAATPVSAPAPTEAAPATT